MTLRKMAPASPGLSGPGVQESASTGFEISPIAEAKLKDTRTLAGIKSGKYYSMVHQYPDVIARYGRGPTNLDWDTRKMSYPNGVFIPLTQRGHDRIAQHRREMEEKAAEEDLRRRSSLRKLWDRMAKKRPRQGSQNTALDAQAPQQLPLPVVTANVSNRRGASTTVDTAAVTANQDDNISDSSTRPVGEAPGSLPMLEDLQPDLEARGQPGINGHEGVEQRKDEESPMHEEEESPGEQGGGRATRFGIDTRTCGSSYLGSISAPGSIRNMNGSTVGSTDAIHLQKQATVASDRTFKVPTRMQNAFLSNRGSELSLEANNNAIEAA